MSIQILYGLFALIGTDFFITKPFFYFELFDSLFIISLS